MNGVSIGIVHLDLFVMLQFPFYKMDKVSCLSRAGYVCPSSYKCINISNYNSYLNAPSYADHSDLSNSFIHLTLKVNNHFLQTPFASNTILNNNFSQVILAYKCYLSAPSKQLLLVYRALHDCLSRSINERSSSVLSI